MNNKNVSCSVVVPLYNEELVANESFKRLFSVMTNSGESFEIIFVNDGSRDRTAEIISSICSQHENVKLISFSRNFGHQNAISAGMDFATGQSIVVIDGDLQDPPEVIPQMLKKWREGYDVVYGKRIDRKGESFFKKITASFFYRFMRSMTDVDIPVDTGDFRLIDRKVCDSLKRIKEKNRYIRGLISWLGFKQTSVDFSRDKRFAGETKYPLKKMLKFAFDAITSFSYRPLKLASYAGLFASLLSFSYLLYVLYIKFFTDKTISGWTSLVAITLFLNGFILIILGIIGEYIGRIYDEAKARPLYIVKEALNISAISKTEQYDTRVVLLEKNDEIYHR